MRFLKDLIKSNHDIKGETALLVHVLAGCNLRCCGCHNIDMIENTDSYETMEEEELLKKIDLIANIFDNLIISGGEPTLYAELPFFLEKVRKIYSGKIILYSNGYNHDMIVKLIVGKLVDGIHMDIKYDIFIEESNDSIGNSCKEYASNALLSSCFISLSEIAKDSIFRTVKYPKYTEEYLSRLKEHVKLVCPNVVYEQNDFIAPEPMLGV